MIILALVFTSNIDTQIKENAYQLLQLLYHRFFIDVSAQDLTLHRRCGVFDVRKSLVVIHMVGEQLDPRRIQPRSDSFATCQQQWRQHEAVSDITMGTVANDESRWHLERTVGNATGSDVIRFFR